jgi:hypothetical protein
MEDFASPESHGLLTKEEADAMARRFILTAEIEGMWVALCECGQRCGVILVEPVTEECQYLACPTCGKANHGAESDAKPIRWVKGRDGV